MEAIDIFLWGEGGCYGTGTGRGELRYIRHVIRRRVQAESYLRKSTVRPLAHSNDDVHFSMKPSCMRSA